MTVSRTDATECEKCHSKHIHRDPDVLDTWFSSALWPFSTLGWPEQTADLDFYYPTSVMVTGYDIIFFWVARLILSGCEQMHKIPFHTCLLYTSHRTGPQSLRSGRRPDRSAAGRRRLRLHQGHPPGADEDQAAGH